MTGPGQTGKCLCGAVRYEVDVELRPVWYCHCEHCRRTSGHHVAATAARSSSLTVDDEGQALRWYSAQPGVAYGFCRRCGSSLFWRSDDRPQTISIMAGTLDSTSGLLVEGELFWDAAARYVAPHPGAERVGGDRSLSGEATAEGCCA